MNKVIKIYCEGKKGSHDYDILEKLLPSISIKIEPIGSKRGAGSAIQVYEKLADKSNFYLFFRDRDFDTPVPKTPSLTCSNYTYFSYRTTIENYLFNTHHFFDFISENKLKTKYQIHTEIEVKKVFIKAAENIRFYQAIRHTMGKMRTGETNFGTTWTNESGTLPINLSEEYCKQQALEKINKAKLLADNWTKNTFEQELSVFLSQFDEHFMNNLDFLIHFQGKDFATSLQRFLPDFPMKDYYKFAKKHFDYNQFPDLNELRTILEQHL